MERLKEIKSKLEFSIMSELDKGIENVDCEEMYKACDMLKDVSTAYYYCALVKAMNKSEYGVDYDEYGVRMTPENYREIERATHGRMYYTETEEEHKPDHHENDGISWEMRRKYYDVKHTNDMDARTKAIDEYAKSLTQDVMDMIQNTSDTERQMLRTKMTMLVQKI